MLEWRRLAANRKVRRMAASIPNAAPVVHLPPAEAGTIYTAWWTEAHVCEQLAQSCT